MVPDTIGGNSENYAKIIESVLNINVEIGIIYISSNNSIIYLNACAINQLQLQKSQISSNIAITSLNEYLLEGNIYDVEIDEKQYKVVGNIHRIALSPNEYIEILIFNSINTLKSKVLDFMGKIPAINLDSILGKSESIEKIKANIKKIANSASSVCIMGESGTGKKLTASVIHYESNRSDKPFVSINCASVSDNLIESELFGYVKGGFAGADDNGKIGKFELANKGILFLNEIDSMPLFMQAKLLRVLRNRTMSRIGSSQIIPLDIRIITATEKDLKQMVADKTFIEDLYYMIYAFPIELPALRDRREDFSILLKHFIEKYNRLLNKNVHTITEGVYQAFQRYDWQGNIKELESVIEMLINQSDSSGVINVEMLSKSLKAVESLQPINEKASVRPLTEVEDEYIKKALDIYGWDTKGKKTAAGKLGIGIATLYRKTKYMD